MLAGVLLARWLVHRMRARGASVVLLTLGLIPVIGVFVNLAQVGAEVWMRVRRERRSADAAPATRQR